MIVRLGVLDLKHNLSIRIESLSSPVLEVLPGGEMHLVGPRLELLPAQEVRSSPVIVGDSALQFSPHLLPSHPVH